MVRYPDSINGCWEITQYYDDNELHEVLYALSEGIKKKNIDIINDRKENITEILDNIWNETEKIKFKANVARLTIGLVGSISAGFSGVGILAGLGFPTIDKIIEMKMDSIGMKIAKFLSPNYLVAIYDFKKEYSI